MSNTQTPQQAATAAHNNVIDAVAGQLLRQLAAAEARAAGLAAQLQGAQAELAALRVNVQEKPADASDA